MHLGKQKSSVVNIMFWKGPVLLVQKARFVQVQTRINESSNTELQNGLFENLVPYRFGRGMSGRGIRPKLSGRVN